MISCQDGGVVYHADFWVTAGTAAPVIALALVVASADSISIRASIVERPLVHFKDFSKTLMISTVIVTCLTYFVTAAVLTGSLTSLAEEQDYVRPSVVINLLGVGISGVFVVTVLNALLRVARRRHSPTEPSSNESATAERQA